MLRGFVPLCIPDLRLVVLCSIPILLLLRWSIGKLEQQGVIDPDSGRRMRGYLKFLGKMFVYGGLGGLTGYLVNREIGFTIGAWSGFILYPIVRVIWPVVDILVNTIVDEVAKALKSLRHKIPR